MQSDRDYVELIKVLARYIEIHEIVDKHGAVTKTSISYDDGFIHPFTELTTGQAALLSGILQT